MAARDLLADGAPLWRRHELVFAIPAGESEPVDPGSELRRSTARPLRRHAAFRRAPAPVASVAVATATPCGGPSE